MNINLINTLLIKETNGDVTQFYLDPSVVELFEQTTHSKFDKPQMKELLALQRDFDEGLVTLEILAETDGWSELRIEKRGRSKMYCITYTAVAQIEDRKRRSWRFWR